MGIISKKIKNIKAFLLFLLFSLGSLIFFLKVTQIVLTVRNQKFILTLTTVSSLSQPLTIDLCCFYLSHILWQLSWYYSFYFALFRSTMPVNARSSHWRCSVRRGVLWYLLKSKTRLLTSRTKLNLPLETNIQIQMFGLTLQIIDHNIPPPYMANSLDLITHDKYLPNVYTHCHIFGAILYLISLSRIDVLFCSIQISF